MPLPRRRYRPWLERLDAAAAYWLGAVVPAPDDALRAERWRRDRRSAYCPRCGISVGMHEVAAHGRHEVDLHEQALHAPGLRHASGLDHAPGLRRAPGPRREGDLQDAARVASGAVALVDAASMACGACRSRRLPWTTVVRLGPYAPPLSDWILSIKAGPRWGDMAERLGQDLGAALRRLALDAVAGGARRAGPIVVPVPMPMLRRWHRGIDHARAIAGGVGGRLQLPVRQVLRRGDRASQVTLAASGRRRGAGRGLRPRRGLWSTAADGIRGRRVLLVDDVLTTGTTARACAKALLALGAADIVLAVLAVTDPPGRGSASSRDRSPLSSRS